MPKRLAIARLSHGGNSFSPVLTGQAAFARREWVAGEAARALPTPRDRRRSISPNCRSARCQPPTCHPTALEAALRSVFHGC